MVMNDISTYSVVLTPAHEGGYIVTVPSIPGCFTEGDTYEEALSNAREAIELCLEQIRASGEDVPIESAPSAISSVSIFSLPQHA
jgi:predicted RNase H-like HicB family nuclease